MVGSLGRSGGAASVSIPTVPTALVNGKARTTASKDDVLTMVSPLSGASPISSTLAVKADTTTLATTLPYTFTASDAGKAITIEGAVNGVAYTTAAVNVAALPVGDLEAVSKPANTTLQYLGGDDYQIEAASGPYAANSPYPFTGAALTSAKLLILATADITGADTAGSTKTATDPLVVGLESSGGILYSRAWRTGGSANGSTGLTYVLTSGDVAVGTDVTFTVQNDDAIATSSKVAVIAAPFEPTDAVELENWIDARSDANFTLTGTRIDAAIDKSGKVRNWDVTNSTATRPVKGPSVIQFSGASGVGLMRPAYYQSRTDRTTFFLLKMAPDTSFIRSLLEMRGAGTPSMQDVDVTNHNATTYRTHLNNDAGTGIVSSYTAPDQGAAVTPTDWHVLEAVNSANSKQILVNGTLVYSKTFTASGTYTGAFVGLFGTSNADKNIFNNPKGTLSQFAHLSTVDTVKRGQMRNWMLARRDELIAGGF